MNRKKPYKRPKLIIHGNLNRITKEFGTNGPSDGTYPAFPSN